MDKELRRNLSRSILRYPSSARSELLGSIEGDRVPAVDQLAAAQLHSIFLLDEPPADSVAQERLNDVKTVLGSLRKQATSQEVANQTADILEALETHHELGSQGFWEAYFQSYSKVRGEEQERFQLALKTEFGPLGYILRNPARASAGYYLSWAIDDEALSALARKMGVIVLPEFPDKTIEDAQHLSGRTISELLTPDNPAQSFGLDSPLLDRDSDLGAKTDLSQALSYYNARSSEVRAAQFVNSIENFMSANELVLADAIWSLLLTIIDAGRSEGALDMVLLDRLESLGLNRSDSELILSGRRSHTSGGNRAAASAESASAGDYSPQEFDERLYGDFEYLAESGRISEAYAELNSLSDQGITPQTRRVKDIAAHIESRYRSLEQRGNEGLAAAKQWHLSEANEILRELRNVDPVFPGIGNLEAAIRASSEASEAQERARVLSTAEERIIAAQSSLSQFDLPKTRALMHDVETLGGDELPGYGEVQRAISAAEKDPFWGFRNGHPGVALNPFEEPGPRLSLNTILEDKNVQRALIAFTVGNGLDIALSLFVFSSDSASVILTAAFSQALFLLLLFFNSVKKSTFTIKLLSMLFLVAFFLGSLSAFSIGYVFGVAGFAVAFYHIKRAANSAKKANKLRERYVDLRNRSNELKAIGPKPELFSPSYKVEVLDA